MARTVLVVTDRPMFAANSSPMITGLGAIARVVGPSDLVAVVTKNDCLLFDSDSSGYREQDDELLVALGFVRALGAVACVAASSARASEIDDLAAELCPGLIAHSADELNSVVSRLLKRADGRAATRFEYVTVSPRDAELLAIFSDGHAALLSRPCADDDDGSDITAIDLAQDASSATLTLATGGSFVLSADTLAPRAPEATNGIAYANALDGAKVGSRLRELRKAAGLTQAELARRTGIHRPNIARVEAGRHTPSLDTLARIAAAIGVPATRVLSVD